MNPGRGAEGPGSRLALLASRLRDYAAALERARPGSRVRLARPLRGVPAADALDALLAREAEAFPAGPRPAPPYAPDLDAFRRQIAECRLCPLGERRRTLVFGEGPAGAPLAFVGTAPGYDEEARSSPLAGAAGELFDRMLAAMGRRRDGVYVCNLLKCRSHGPGGPDPRAWEACRPHLEHQLALVAPKAVVALGEAPARLLLGRGEPLAALRGRWGEFRGLKVMPTYHPADLLRDEGLKRHVWDDLKQVLRVVGGAPAPR